MRLVFGLVLLLGVGLAGVAVYMARDFFAQQQLQLAEAEAAKSAIVPTSDVMVVNKQMRYGQRLTTKDVKIVRWPTAAVPSGAFTSVEELFPDGNEELRSILRTMEADEAILSMKVTEPGQDAGVSSRLSSGKRAFTVRTDVSTGVSGFLRPGDRVDVYWTGKKQGVGVTQLIQSAVRIIAINQSADEDNNSPVVARTVTVEVNPTEVAKLAQAQSTGRLSLSLLGADETVVSVEVEVDQRDLLGIQVEEAAQQERKCFVMRRVGEELRPTNIETECTN
ncbi:MAG: Flp pilus assembly protein CpaB [Pseudomonadota bacterium]